MKRFTKIKVASDGTTSLDWTTIEDAETHTHALVCKESPDPAFVTALNALLADVLVVVELPDSYADGMRVSGITLSLTEKTGARGATVAVLKTVKIANGPLTFSTPHLIGDPAPDDEAPDDDRRGHMPPGMWARILDVEREGWDYLDGKRAPKAQAELFDETDDDDDEAPEPTPTEPTRRRRPRDPLAIV